MIPSLGNIGRERGGGGSRKFDRQRTRMTAPATSSRGLLREWPSAFGGTTEGTPVMFGKTTEETNAEIHQITHEHSTTGPTLAANATKLQAISDVKDVDVRDREEKGASAAGRRTTEGRKDN